MKKLKDILIIFTFISLLSVFLNAVSKEKLELCLKILSGLTVLNILLLCFDMFFASKEYLIAFHGIDNIGPGRVRYPASQIAVVAPLVFGYLYYIKSKKLLGCLFMAFVFLVIVSTGGRSALLSLLVGSGFMFMVMAIKSKRMNLKMLLVGAASFIVLFFVGLAGYKYVDQRGGKNEFDRRMTMNSKDLSAGRFDIWKFTWEESIKKPFLGVGVGGYRTLTKDPAVVLPAKNHPHNFVLEILVSVGFIGLLASLCVLLYLFINYFTYGTGFGVFAMGSFVTYWVNSLTSVSIIQAYWMTLFAVSFVIGYFTMKKEKA
jgi:O-antigen ligase